MGSFTDTLSDADIEWIHKQKVYFVSTAPLAKNGHVNASPKGYDSLRVLANDRMLMLDGRGSGCETIAHLRENARITVMMCAFEGPPRIMRFFGTAVVYEPGQPEFERLFAEHYAADWDSPDRLKFVRSIIDMRLHRVGKSCGFAVPFMEFQKERPTLVDYYKNKSDEVLASKSDRDNSFSIDGIPSYLAGTRSAPSGVSTIKRSVASAAGAMLPWVGGAAVGAAIALAAVRNALK
ncbi:hypothetical protein LPJ53_005399 [Coemansia erecta]|uniref:Pyridoxamine 5'-phosphate oxidase N-terminal domain-containing protein n=1 Tax=Coemansia erecta TaxID=147472 RepID=A0A9W7XWY8_9FUNG|nr:hypothetical protein LPJ53_005399 [Coemansia erecta]